MADDQAGVDKASFHSILASSVHDMKNTLALLTNTLAEVIAEVPPESKSMLTKITQLEYLGTELNNNLMQLLAIYKIDSQQYPFAQVLQPLYDCLEEQMLRYVELAQRRGISIELECAEELLVPFDHSLVGGVINNSLGNALRYAKSAIRIAVTVSDNLVTIAIEDDGPGFPQAVLAAGSDCSIGIDYNTTSTGLGLYFCNLVAKLHRSDDSLGSVTIDNDGQLGGGRFSLLLPLL